MSNIVYGRRALREILRHRRDLISKLVLNENLTFDPDLDELLKGLKGQRKVEYVSKQELDKLSEGGIHQGVLAYLNPMPTVSLEDLIEQSKSGRGVLVVLDQVVDPHNLGAILRVVEASGADGLVITKDRSASLTPVARKASAGASELVPVVEVKNLQRALSTLKESGFWIIGTGIGEDGATSLFKTELPSPIALVLGSEGSGIRLLTKKNCDILIELPMSGVIESLNVSQAASVILYELLRRRA